MKKKNKKPENKVLNTMNINIDQISLENIENQKLINHNKELKDLQILFKKVEDDN